MDINKKDIVENKDIVEDKDLIDDDKLVPIIAYVPNNTVKLTLVAKLYNEDNDSFCEAENTMNISKLREAMIDGDAWEADNVKYVFTDKAKEILGIK